MAVSMRIRDIRGALGMSMQHERRVRTHGNDTIICVDNTPLYAWTKYHHAHAGHEQMDEGSPRGMWMGSWASASGFRYAADPHESPTICVCHAFHHGMWYRAGPDLNCVDRAQFLLLCSQPPANRTNLQLRSLILITSDLWCMLTIIL